MFLDVKCSILTVTFQGRVQGVSRGDPRPAGGGNLALKRSFACKNRGPRLKIALEYPKKDHYYYHPPYTPIRLNDGVGIKPECCLRPADFVNQIKGFVG